MKTWDVIYQFRATADGQLETQCMGLLTRCKDCEYAIDEYGDGDCYCRNEMSHLKYIGVDWNHYCAWALRKEEK